MSTVMYERGEGVEKDAGKAFEWYHKAAEGGDVQAQACVAEYLESGVGKALGPAQEDAGGRSVSISDEQQDESEAFLWWLKAARGGDPEAQFHVGRMLNEGKGTPRNLQQVPCSHLVTIQLTRTFSLGP